MLLKGDCVEVMKAIKSNSIDTIITDPPYGLEFMGKKWDKLRNTWQAEKGRYHNDTTFIAKGDRIRYQAGLEMQLWHTQWLTEAYRVMKPGASMLVMGGTRTFHRLMVAIEDTGFIIKDTLMWLYGSGFPKAQDLGKMIDKRGKKHRFPHILLKFQKSLNTQRIKKGLTLNKINKLFGVPPNSGCAAHKFCDKSQPQFPTMEQMKILADILDLNDMIEIYGENRKLWKVYDEIEREIIGFKKAGLGTGNTYAFTEDNIKAQKELDVTAPSTDLAKHWDGFKVGGIKPAYEPIVWAVKPPEGSYIDNVLKWGVGAVNVDECRVVYQNNSDRELAHQNALGPIERYKTHKQIYGGGRKSAGFQDTHSPKGRFPANVILSHHPECMQVGMKRAKTESGGKGINKHAIWGTSTRKVETFNEGDGYETVESWDCHPDCPIRLLDEQSGLLHAPANKLIKKHIANNLVNLGGGNIGITAQYQDSGGASRFFYCAKASRSERNRGLEGMKEKQTTGGGGGIGNYLNDVNSASGKYGSEKAPAKNNHPTVKPIALFEWLIKLVTREGQVVLDPFIGSGTTAIAAHKTGRKYIGIEKESEYLEIAKKRIDYWEKQPIQMDL